jgi:hypothetical protein
LNKDKRKLADAFPDFVVAYNDTLAQEGLPLSERQTFATDDKSAKELQQSTSIMTHAPRGEPLVTERSQEPIRDIDL